jgi:small subunit ribosomal protein S16
MRTGRKKRPLYRIVAMEVNVARNGSRLGQVGHYDPLHAKVEIDEEAALLWLNRGAQMTPTVKSLLHSQGVLARWKGLEFTVREDALLKDKPKRRRKLAAAAAQEETPAEEDAAAQAES